MDILKCPNPEKLPNIFLCFFALFENKKISITII